MVYFAQLCSTGEIKIGSTISIFTRIASLEGHYGSALWLLATMPGDLKKEREIQRRFHHLRVPGSNSKGHCNELFSPGHDLIRFIYHLKLDAYVAARAIARTDGITIRQFLRQAVQNEIRRRQEDVLAQLPRPAESSGAIGA